MSGDISTPEMCMFKDVIPGALYIDIGPYSCIPFINIRKVTRTDVLRFVSIFADGRARTFEPAAAELSCRSDTAVVVMLEEKNHHLIDAYFKAEGNTETEAQQAIHR